MKDVRENSYQLSGKNFKFICDYVYDSAGIVLGEAKREMLYRRLTRVIRERKLPSFDAYCDLLRSQPEQERTYFINAITTNLTSFYREQHHFDYLAKHEFPKLLNKNSDSKRIRLWSSASSTGEEPYSLGITTHQSFAPVLSQWDIKILATDIDSNVLATAKEGVYTANRVEGISQSIQQKYFKKGTGANETKVRVIDEVRSLITFKQLNLLHEWPVKGPFDVIFCRNVIIYFDKATQQDLFARYYELLAPGGLLMLGHSENLGEYQRYFENVGRTIFRKPE
ncbi:CheR family methyltransferase [Thalassotalea euphylliae]|uniref:Chemotaxis protein methyltransferase n=1 Tax=Thalassotalea euphylliae TaxID=1655234 RepID=A0A3E0UFG9_9GAMM|nr:protein-glutamate O-methyltransferase CheR [Thalassotalea euphylliae]REL35317.1 protein-glutamate O-methyltransferase CheR [Thalassotalea euphylliae]